MRLALLTCAVFPSEEEARRKMWIFLKSCEKFHAPDPHLYGLSRGFPGYRAMKLDFQLDYLKSMNRSYTHVLYTDGWDAFLTAEWRTIQKIYADMDRPEMLVAAYDGLANVSEPDKDYPGCFPGSGYKYPNVGGYIADRHFVIAAFESMLRLPRQTGDDCFNWYDAWQEGWFRPTLDSSCSIFQVTDRFCDVDGGHLFNRSTKSHPCILHLCGGWTSPETGKDDRMIPWAQALGVI